LLQSFPESYKLFFLELKGANVARNFGIAKSQSELLFFLDDDCKINYPSFLKQHVDYHVHNASLFAAGGGYCLNESAQFLDEIYNYLQMRWFLSAEVETPRSRFLLGGNFSVKKQKLIENHILFDEKIAYGGTEYDFFKRAELAGLEMHMNQGEVSHLTAESFLSLSRKIFKQGKGKAIIDQRYPKSNFIVSDYNNNETLSLVRRLTLVYFNYVFWWGYYCQLKQKSKIIRHLFKDSYNYVNFYRYKTIERVNNEIVTKKNKGDRF
jgi:glycosyltransferase involved in cell wall biosynthesis